MPTPLTKTLYDIPKDPVPNRKKETELWHHAQKSFKLPLILIVPSIISEKERNLEANIRASLDKLSTLLLFSLYT